MNLSLVRIQKSILATLPWGLRYKSNDGREFQSEFYDAYNPQIRPQDGAERRFYARVQILGDRRPYDLVAEVIEEKFDKKRGKYRQKGVDRDATASYQAYLVRRLEGKTLERDLIDEFKTF